MTKKSKILVYLLLIIAILLKEEVYHLLFSISIRKEIQKTTCEVKNEVLEKNYQELIKAYGYEENLSYHVEPTRILYRNIYNLNDTLTLYKGEEENIKEKNLVINEQGLVGIVSKVNKHTCEVDLLMHKDLHLSVKINDSYGILKYKDGKFIVEGINNKGNVQEKDKITTSDISIYPENVLVGYVETVKDNTYEIEKIITVTPSVNFENLKYMSIITDLRGEK